MSDPRPAITIRDPDRLNTTLEDMIRRGRAEDFAVAYMRLLNQFSLHIADAPAETTRTAEVWADPHTANSFYWCIWQHADGRASRFLAGALHFHESDQTWGIHT